MKKNNVIKLLICLFALQLLGGVTVEGMNSTHEDGMPTNAGMATKVKRECHCCQQCADRVGAACACCCGCAKGTCEMVGDTCVITGAACMYCLLLSGEWVLQLAGVGDSAAQDKAQ